MNRQELQNMLAQAGVHPSLYSLGQPAQSSESYSLIADGSDWKILYKERGQYEEVRAGLSEDEACQLMYSLLGPAFNFGRRNEA